EHAVLGERRGVGVRVLPVESVEVAAHQVLDLGAVLRVIRSVHGSLLSVLGGQSYRQWSCQRQPENGGQRELGGGHRQAHGSLPFRTSNWSRRRRSPATGR